MTGTPSPIEAYSRSIGGQGAAGAEQNGEYDQHANARDRRDQPLAPAFWRPGQRHAAARDRRRTEHAFLIFFLPVIFEGGLRLWIGLAAAKSPEGNDLLFLAVRGLGGV